ncbi:putative sphinganine-1-phosphate aldolase [Helianthus annuus]|nr:putative sphinganine-1-phosphate aldolase [Helianthus annuus]
MESSILPTLIQLRASANSFLSQFEPLAIVVAPIVSFLIARVLQSFVQLIHEKGVKATVIGFVMTLFKLVPGVQKYIDAEKQKRLIWEYVVHLLKFF